ncbi:hypothetical protein K2173_006541 [Erythroxylum novogranatense]|uniref:DUF4283 domain-containing protein n=1 Tax=Erythroxylum novogranatense TaxID=1862640 RepID=A0AAV8T786_9ROSI|nr:hypothetical protein K2173_006541 [Erythroxylum novogranatense]
MALPDSAPDPFPPLPSSPSSGSHSPSRALVRVEGGAPTAVPPVVLAGGAWGGHVGASQPRGQLSYHPNVLLDGSKRLAFPVVNAWAKARWGKKAFEKALLMEDGLFLFKFSPQSNICEILELGPWHIGNQPLFLRQWTTGMSLDRGSVEVIPLWVQFHELLMEYWTLEGLSHLASSIGKPICLDSQTAKMERIGFAKICVDVSKETALPDSLKIRRLDELWDLSYTTISVTYPWMLSATQKQWVSIRRRFHADGNEVRIQGDSRGHDQLRLTTQEPSLQQGPASDQTEASVGVETALLGDPPGSSGGGQSPSLYTDIAVAQASDSPCPGLV